MTKKHFEKLVDKIAESGEDVLFETSYGSFYLYVLDGSYRLEMTYKYVSGLDSYNNPIYQYMDDYVWDCEYLSREALFKGMQDILAKDPYGTDYSKRKAKEQR